MQPSEQRRVERNKHFIRAFKEFTGCQRCPERRAACLQFHHKDPLCRKSSRMTHGQIRRREISTLVGKGAPLKLIVEEIEKCELLCANCHAIETGKWIAFLADYSRANAA